MEKQAAIDLMKTSKDINQWNRNRAKVMKQIPKPAYCIKLVDDIILDKRGKPLLDRKGNVKKAGTHVKVVSSSNAIPIIGYIDSGLIDEVLPNRRKEWKKRIEEQRLMQLEAATL